MPSSGGQTSALDRKSTRLNSSHGSISYAVFCLKNTTFLPVGRTLSSAPQAPGLGRGMSRDVARGMKGELTVTSAVGSGSTFFFFNDGATTEIYALSLHAGLPI